MDTERKQKIRRRLLLCGWIGYLVILGYLVFFSGGLGREAAAERGRFNLIPFQEIHRFLHYWEKIGSGFVFLNVLGNVLAFVPFGMMTPELFPVFRKAVRMILLGLAVSLLIETLQLVLRVGVFDVDDLILNTLGTALGYGFYLLFRRHPERKRG